MTLRAADLRFVLPHPVRTATVLPSAPSALAEGLRSAGVDVAPAPVRADLVVAGSGDVRAALDVPASSYLLFGRARVPVRVAVTTPLLVRGAAEAPTMVVPTKPSTALAYHLGAMRGSASRAGGLRSRAAATLVRQGIPLGRLLPRTSVVTLLTRSRDGPPAPALIAAARDLGVPPGVAWLLALGRGDDLQRLVFHLLDGARPAWVLKAGRVPGAGASFARDEAGLGLVRVAGGTVAEHAPSHLGGLEVAGLRASVETAAPGGPLLGLLRHEPQELVDRVADWVVRVGVQTATPPAALDAERTRLRHDVLPRWAHAGADPALLDRLPPVPGVLAHHDLGSWNVVTDGHSFVAVDWESARAETMPLWDLVYFLGDALVRMDGPAPPDQQLARCLDLFRGRSPRSASLFGWIRTAVARLDLPPESVGVLTTLCWLHHGLSASTRADSLGDAAAAPIGHLARMAEPWLADPALGPTWSAWSA